MGTEQKCECGKPVVLVPVRGLQLALDQEALEGVCCDGGGGSPGAGIDYSFEEQWTGKRWVDGKKIYQKTVDCGGIPNKANKVVAHEIDNIEYVVTIFGIASREGVWCTLPTVNKSGNIAVAATPTSIEIETVTDLSRLNKSYVTLHYTCTDR